MAGVYGTPFVVCLIELVAALCIRAQAVNDSVQSSLLGYTAVLLHC
jgi:hypothetical protein